MKPRQGQSESQAAISVQAVTIPTPPPASPENTFTPPPTVNQEPPKPIPQPDPVAPRPISTPIPRNTPIPTPTPQASTPAMTPRATPTPNPLASSRPTPNPAMSAVPTPPPSLTPEQQKQVREQIAKSSLIDVMKKQGLEVDENYVPPNGTTYEEMLKLLSPEEQAKLDAAVAAYNKSVFDKFNPTLVATPNPNATPDPNASANSNNPGDPNGDPNGTGSGIFNNSDPNREINNIDRKVNEFDPALVDPSSNPFGKPNLNSNGIDNNVPFSGNPLDDSERELERGIDVPTSLSNPRPSPTPIPLPDFRATATGWTFPYDGRSFAVTIPDGIEEGQSILINSLVKTRPRDTSKSFELIWKLQWESNTNLLIKAVIDEYEIRKKNGL